MGLGLSLCYVLMNKGTPPSAKPVGLNSLSTQSVSLHYFISDSSKGQRNLGVMTSSPPTTVHLSLHHATLFFTTQKLNSAVHSALGPGHGCFSPPLLQHSCVSHSIEHSETLADGSDCSRRQPVWSSIYVTTLLITLTT